MFNTGSPTVVNRQKVSRNKRTRDLLVHQKLVTNLQSPWANPTAPLTSNKTTNTQHTEKVARRNNGRSQPFTLRTKKGIELLPPLFHALTVSHSIHFCKNKQKQRCFGGVYTKYTTRDITTPFSIQV